jgi:hypothetical protein
MKSLSVLLVTVAMLVACGKKEEPVATPTPAVVDTAAAPAPSAAPAEEAKK